jgi:hypothetical protein
LSWSILWIWLIWTDETRSRAIWKKKENYTRLVDRAISQVRFEIEQVDQLLETYADLLERVQVTPLVEVWEQTKGELWAFLDTLGSA